MKSSTATFLQTIVVLIGLAALVFLLGEPHLEGRNAQATTFEIYFNDPFLAFVYAGSVPFFVALHRAFRLLGHAGKHGTFSPVTVDALLTIKKCALTVLGFVVVAAMLILRLGDGEDRPGGLFMCLLVALGSAAAATTSALLARNLQAALRQSAIGRD